MTTKVEPFHQFTYGTATIVIYHANKGEGLPRHDHRYSHGTYCSAGRVIVRKESKELELDKRSAPINLVRGEWHEIEALEDETVIVNVFETRLA
jgi:quercetin dioxygenase-like cupin family protein